MKITLAQLNPIIGRLDHNFKKVSDTIKEHRHSDLIVFSEMVTTGYPPKDLVLDGNFVQKIIDKIDHLANEMVKLKSDIQVALGTPYLKNRQLYNAVVILYRGKIIKVITKNQLPNYDIFDEKRYFHYDSSAETSNNLIQIGDKNILFSICEDIWSTSLKSSDFQGSSQVNQWAEKLKAITAPVDLIINISASPFDKHKSKARETVVNQFVKKLNCPLIYVNQVGANDEIIFDGNSFVMDNTGKYIARLASFREEVTTVNLVDEFDMQITKQPLVESIDSNYFNALVLGVSDYFKKTGFKKALIGISGGIDSALVAVIATEALGKENVEGIALPSKYNSLESFKDAQSLANNLGISLLNFPIENIIDEFRKQFKDEIEIDLISLADQNLQARVRGNVLMTYSNQTGRLLLTTGNKSELAMGYATLYGDMCGALSVIGDLFKTEVYGVCRWINQVSSLKSAKKVKPLIPENIITKEPSAELRPNQKDSDSLPPYIVLDVILEGILLKHKSIEELSKEFDKELVELVDKLLKVNEYKRSQAPMVLRVSEKAFGLGRRIPIVR